MHNRQVTIRIKGQPVTCVIFLDADDNGKEVIKFKAMYNEYFLSFEISVPDERDLAYNLIKHFPIKVIQDRMLQCAYDNEAIN